MTVVVSRHARQFQGRTFRRDPASRWSSNRRYFKPSLKDMRAGVRPLHVEVWKSVRGPIAAGFQVHHRAGNTNRNRVRDLTLLATVRHQAHHIPKDLAAARAYLASIRPFKGSPGHAKGLATRARKRKRRAP